MPNFDFSGAPKGAQVDPNQIKDWAAFGRDLFTPQIIDENNNTRAAPYEWGPDGILRPTPTVNPFYDSEAGVDNQMTKPYPTYFKLTNGNGGVLRNDGTMVDTGQRFNDVEHGFGPLAMIQELSPMIAVAAGPLFLEFGLTGMLTEALGSVGSKLAQSAIVQFVTTGDISPTGLLTSAAGSAAMGALGDAAGGSLGNLDDGISFSVLDDNPAIYSDLVGDDMLAGGGGAYVIGAADAVGSENSFDDGSMVGANNSGANIVTGAPSGVDIPTGVGGENSFDDGGMAGANNSGADIVTGSPASGGGILDRGLEWAKSNQVLATGLVTTGAGLLSGIGTSLGADERLDKTIEAQKDLIKEKAAAELQALEDKRKHVQSGSYWTGKFGYKAPTGPLRRPDGSLVYAPGGGLLNRK